MRKELSAVNTGNRILSRNSTRIANLTRVGHLALLHQIWLFPRLRGLCLDGWIGRCQMRLFFVVVCCLGWSLINWMMVGHRCRGWSACVSRCTACWNEKTLYSKRMNERMQTSSSFCSSDETSQSTSKQTSSSNLQCIRYNISSILKIGISRGMLNWRKNRKFHAQFIKIEIKRYSRNVVSIGKILWRKKVGCECAEPEYYRHCYRPIAKKKERCDGDPEESPPNNVDYAQPTYFKFHFLFFILKARSTNSPLFHSSWLDNSRVWEALHIFCRPSTFGSRVLKFKVHTHCIAEIIFRPWLGGTTRSIVFLFAFKGQIFLRVCLSSSSASSISSTGRILMLRLSRIRANSVVVKWTVPSSATGIFILIRCL